MCLQYMLHVTYCRIKLPTPLLTATLNIRHTLNIKFYALHVHRHLFLTTIILLHSTA